MSKAAAAIDPRQDLQNDLEDAKRIKADIENRLEVARAVPAALDHERQPHILASVIGDADATAILDEIKRRAFDAAQLVADLEFALDTINTRIAGCRSRLKEAEHRELDAKALALANEGGQHWRRIEQLCNEIHDAYASARDIATQLDQIAHKYRDPTQPSPMWVALNACPEKLAGNFLRCADGGTMRQAGRLLQGI